MTRPGTKNACAGPFGAVYSAYIERPWLARRVVGLVWGADVSSLYADVDAVLAGLAGGETVLDVPCGGGLELRGLRPGQDVRFIAADLDPAMVERTRRRAQRDGLTQVEAVVADMTALPFEDAIADVALCYSGLHMVAEPQAAIAELARCLKPGGRLHGATFTTDGARRMRWLFERGARLGHAPLSGSSADLGDWLRAAGLVDVEVEPGGLALFRARKP
jgi:SAM-dependent methyltransferase